ncbi:MipA/OmpV family protein [Mesorhizobium sp. CAU 1741]|uniref:MipA/OmpV family protein n=1 Tax=Mesorhizobium sp. CAU 1741 TaxID=3140366 RepID=UPI00325A9D29
MARTGTIVATAIALVSATATGIAQSYEQQGGYLPPVASSQQLADDMQPQGQSSQTMAQAAPADTYAQPQQTYDYGASQPDYGYQEEPASSGGPLGWLSGDWYLKVGGAVLYAPKFEGASGGEFLFQPMISLGKHGKAARFSSRNDNIALGLIDTGAFRAGPAAKLIFGRDDDHDDIVGLSEVEFGGELGGFVEVYPTEFVRVRAELRHGINSHDGIVADLSADAFFDITDTVRLSGGPRATWASEGYYEAYYGVDAAESVASGLSPYTPDSGIKSVGAGGAVTWKATDVIDTSVFAEYSRLMGPAADSSLVEERGSRNQFTVGASATYRFDFSLR